MSESPIDPKQFKELFRITNELHRLKLNPKALNKDDYLNLLEQLCNSLTEAFERGLGDIIKAFGQADETTKRDAKEIIQQIGRHSEFVNFSENALRKCGAKPSTAKEIVAAIESLKDEIKKQTDYNADATLAAVNGVQDHVCKAEIQVRHQLTQQETNYIFRRLALTWGGVALLIAGGATTIGSAGLASPAGVAMGTAGTAMIAAGQLGTEPGKKKPR